MLEEEFSRDEKNLKKLNNDQKLGESEEEKSSDSEISLKEENIELIDVIEENFLEKISTKEPKIPTQFDFSEKKLPKGIDFCRFSHDFLCEFSMVFFLFYYFFTLRLKI